MGMRADQIAVQLYTLRDLTSRDLPGTLRAVAQAGFQAVELAGLPPIEAEALRDALGSNGLRPMGSHESLERLRHDLVGILDRMTVLGCPRIVVPWLPEAERADSDGVRRLAAELGQIGSACADRGIVLGYHNHDFEFAPLDGTTVWTVLLDALPTIVELELDVFWASIGGQDPVALIEGADERLRLLHMKDRATGPVRQDVAPGDGILPWPAIADAGTRRGVEWYVIEKDDTTNALADVTSGLRFLSGLAEREV